MFFLTVWQGEVNAPVNEYIEGKQIWLRLVHWNDGEFELSFEEKSLARETRSYLKSERFPVGVVRSTPNQKKWEQPIYSRKGKSEVGI